MKSIAFIAFLIMALLALAGCKSRDTKGAKLFETALFEEKQNNLEHATRLYREIISTYPATLAARALQYGSQK